MSVPTGESREAAVLTPQVIPAWQKRFGVRRVVSR